MIEEEFANPLKRSRKDKRHKKDEITMDMNSMVDLAFLLLTFFMLTTTMLKPKAIELVMPVPDKDDDDITEVQTIKESRALTLVPLPDNELYYFKGFSEAKLIQSDYGKDHIRAVLLDHRDNTEDPIVIIKSHPEAIFENLIDLIDELNITRIERYAIDKFGPNEQKLIEEAGVNLK